mgnify:CR=1 FL=1
MLKLIQAGRGVNMEDVIIRKAKELSEYIIERRRDFHMYPELKYEEKRTSSIVEEELKKLGYEVVRVAETGVIGILKGKSPGRTVALRADMDALPVNEENDVIEDIKVKTFGCVAAIATSSQTTEMAKGKTIDEAYKITKKQVAESLGGLPKIKMHCSNLAVDALRLAIEDYRKKNRRKEKSIR